MPRKPRREESGLIHHACLNAVHGERFFRGPEDRVGFLLMLAATVARYGWLCLSYCLMGTHVHVLIETPEPNFGKGMQWLSSRYVTCFNKQHDRDGHLLMRRYHDEAILTEGHLLNVVGYVAMNPVAAGLCSDPLHWRWGSHHRVVRGNAPVWLAHEHLADRLEAITGSRSTYDELIATRLRPY